MMEKKTTARLDETRAAAKTEEAKAAVKETVEKAKTAVKEIQPAVKETVEETKLAGAAIVKATAKEVQAETKEVVKAVREKRTAKAFKKAEAEELKPEVFIQYQGNETIVAEVIEKAKEQFVAEGHRASSVKSLQVYLKPEEFAAYYVINQKFAGKVDLF